MPGRTPGRLAARRQSYSGVNRRVLMLIRILDSGGVPVHLMELARGLQGRGWTVGLAVSSVAGDHPHDFTWFAANNVPVFQVPFVGPSRSARNVVGGVTAFAKLLMVCRRFRPDLLHVHFRSTSVYARVVEMLMGIPFVSTLHSAVISRHGVFRIASHWGARSIAVSQETYCTLVEDFSVRQDRISLIHNGASEDHFRPPSGHERRAAKVELGLDPDLFTMCSLGRLEPDKRHVDVIDALTLVRERGHELQCVIAGEGSLRAELGATVSEKGLEHAVHFVGYREPRTVYWAADLNVLASLVEGFPMVVVEAMLTAVPTLRTPAAGTADQIEHGRTGLVVNFTSPEQIAELVVTLIEQPEFRLALARGAREFALEKFTARTMTSRTLDVYADVLTSPRAPSRRAAAKASLVGHRSR